MKDNFYSVHHCDSRKLSSVITEQIVDVTITSPPYYDLKDYGYKEQIGFGQSYEDYLQDLKLVFQEVYNCTKETGTLWVIIDSFRKDGKVVPLPFDFSSKIQEVGWKLQEVIIWAKDRTVPWTAKGQMRNLFEYIMVFSKSDRYNFYIDNVRDQTTLKKWWIKYPERYNPKGKAPTGIWNYAIPTQGSWGSGYIKHFCPLPEEMIAQILELTTLDNSVVLDPFAGSGAVLAKADNMNRKYIGFELNEGYIKMFVDYLHKTGVEKKERYAKNRKSLTSQDDFYHLVLRLRALKFARELYKKINKENNIVSHIFVKVRNYEPVKPHALVTVDYHLLIRSSSYVEDVNKLVSEEGQKPPLSKYGVEPFFNYCTNIESFDNELIRYSVYTYTSQATHTYLRELNSCHVYDLKKNEVIISDEKIKLSEKDYDN